MYKSTSCSACMLDLAQGYEKIALANLGSSQLPPLLLMPSHTKGKTSFLPWQTRLSKCILGLLVTHSSLGYREAAAPWDLGESYSRVRLPVDLSCFVPG